MDPLAAIAGGAASLGSALFGDQMSADSQAATNTNNAQMALQQEQYQTQMSNTAYQRSVSDMKAAGLNPGLMFGSGGPESSPSGANIPAQSPGAAYANLGSQVSGAVNTAMSAAKSTADIANTQADTSNKQTQALALSKDPALRDAQTQAAIATAKASTNSAALSAAQAQKVKYETSEERVKSRLWDLPNSALDSAKGASDYMSPSLSPNIPSIFNPSAP